MGKASSQKLGLVVSARAIPWCTTASWPRLAVQPEADGVTFGGRGARSLTHATIGPEFSHDPSILLVDGDQRSDRWRAAVAHTNGTSLSIFIGPTASGRNRGLSYPVQLVT